MCTVHYDDCNVRVSSWAKLLSRLRYTIEVSTGPKFPARPAKFFFGPARNQCIIKFVLYNFFEILQQNQYNYIKLHSYFPLVHLIYCPSTTVMYNVQLYQQRQKFSDKFRTILQNFKRFYENFKKILRKFNKILKDFKKILRKFKKI